MVRMLALLLAVIAVAALMLLVVSVTRAALDRADRAEQRPDPGCSPDAWRQWAAYYRGLAEQARAEGNPGSAATYDSLAETYRLLAGDVT